MTLARNRMTTRAAIPSRRSAAVGVALAVLACVACTPRRIVTGGSAAAGPLWVLAPHPDDEALFGAEPIRRALREGREVRVMVMTNGDLGCERDGHLRQRETVASMARLGLSEDHVRFLGYPDGFLDALGTEPLPPHPRREIDGTCREGATTYASRGEGRRDVHTLRTGAPGTYTADEVVGDLVALLERDRPSDVYVAHPIDEHPDHASTYLFLRRALERAGGALPRVHRALVHVGGCWPNGDRAREPCPAISGELGAPYPPLPAPLDRYLPSERLVVDDGGASARASIALYRSQLHVEVEHDWLGTFARGDAIAWPEVLVRDARGRVIRSAAVGVAAGEARVLAPPRESSSEGLQRIDLAVSHRAPVALEATVQRLGAGSLALALVFHDGPTLGVTISAREVVFVRGEHVLRRLHVPDVEGAHTWSLHADPRPDDGGVVELELRRDELPIAWAIAASNGDTGEAAWVVARGDARLERADVSTR